MAEPCSAGPEASTSYRLREFCENVSMFPWHKNVGKTYGCIAGLFIYAVGIVPVVFSTQPATTQLSSEESRQAPLEKGVVAGNVYRNDSLGLVISLAPSLKVGAPVMKGAPSALPLMVEVFAWDEKNPNIGTIFYADALAYYPKEQRSLAAYVGKIKRTNLKGGFALVNENARAQLGPEWFSRSDFRKGTRFEAVLVQTCNVYALVFIFVGPDVGVVDRVLSQTSIDFAPDRAPCLRIS